MSTFTDFLLNTLSSSLETIGETKLVEVLQQLHDKNPEQYQAAILGGQALVTALLPIVSKTGTKIDDAIVKALSEAIATSSSLNPSVSE
jgi:hypothetical protein